MISLHQNQPRFQSLTLPREGESMETGLYQILTFHNIVKGPDSTTHFQLKPYLQLTTKGTRRFGDNGVLKARVKRKLTLQNTIIS